MRPVKLRFQAFASYAEAAEIDFGKLDSLFLIHGETGAGKTAILDAMMYALYGESSGGERSELRCALPKAADIPTEVEFVFEVRGKKYKFTRSVLITPRSKKLDPKQDCFYFDEESGQFRAFFENPRQSLVRRKAEELTGLSAEQFRQVIILPQGRFERLLTSNSEDKEKILSTLFCAEKYSRLSDKLYEKAEEERRSLALEEAALKAMLAAENADSFEKLSEEIENLSAEAKGLSPRLEAAKKSFADSRESLTAAEVLSESFSQFSAAKKQLEILDSRSGEIAEIKRILSLHERSLKAKPEHAAFCEARQMLKTRIASLSAAEAALSAAEKEYAILSEKQEENSVLEKTIAARTDELTLLNSLGEIYEKIGTAGEAAARISKEYLDCGKNLSLTENSLKKTEKEISEAAQKRDRIISEFSQLLPDLRARKAELENGAENAKNLLRYESALKNIMTETAKLSSQTEAAEKEKKFAESEYDRLYNLYISNTAAELSSRLKEGMPCPVCGSLSHPAPAENSGDVTSSEQVKSARDKFEQAAEALSRKKEALAKEQARIPAAEEYISSCRKVISETGYTPEELAAVSKKCAEAEKQNASLNELGKWISSLNAQKQALEENFRSANQRAETLKAQKTKAETELAVLRERLVPECPDQIAYTMKISALKNEIESFSEKKRAFEEKFAAAEKRRIECKAAFEQAQKEHSAAEKRLENSEKIFFDKLSSLEISGTEQYENSLLPEKTAARYSAEAEQYSMERHSAEKMTETLSAKLEGKTPPDIDEVKAAAENAERIFGELSRQEAVFTEKLSRLKKLSEEYSKRFSDYESAREKSGKRTAFARFMHGDKGISFTRYVLSIMLNLVVSESNRILSDIHGGMFRLCVKTELAANSKQGLDLEVENTTLSSSVKYGVKNLSGGEKFLISLALSLGLSSVAQSRAGGVEIEAMFIDEGFGSLDPASLREAVGILCGLSVGRNTIGIISHVEELRTVIPGGVKIIKSAEGGSKISV